jgi:hypothetical protein
VDDLGGERKPFLCTVEALEGDASAVERSELGCAVFAATGNRDRLLAEGRPFRRRVIER